MGVRKNSADHTCPARRQYDRQGQGRDSDSIDARADVRHDGQGHAQADAHGHDGGHAGLQDPVHGHGHEHGHGHGLAHSHAHGAASSRGRLGFVVGLTVVIFVAEVIGGVFTGSLALLADAGHMLTDAAGLVMALIAMIIGSRAATGKSTYGLQRVEVLAATINALSVLVISVIIAVEAVERGIRGEAHIQAVPMIIVAVIGLIANLISMRILSGHQHGSVNIKGVYLHILVDAAGSLAVIISGFVILLTGWALIDAVVSICIAVIIVPRSWQLLRRCLNVLLERTPEGVDVKAIRRDLTAIDGVTGVHDLHVWSVSGSETLLTAHLEVDHKHLEGGDLCAVLDRAEALLKHDFGITHVTLQFDEPGHRAHEPHMHR